MQPKRDSNAAQVRRKTRSDTVILLKHPQGYTPNQGAAFDFVFEKTRHFAGNEAESFQVRLKEMEDGLWQWVIEEPAVDADLQKVVEAKKRESFRARHCDSDRFEQISS